MLPASTLTWRFVVTASSIRRSCVTSSNVPGYVVQRRLQLLDRGQVEVVRRLVEHQQVDAARLQQRERRPGPLARRQRRRPDAARGRAAEAELGQQRADVGVGPWPAPRRRTRSTSGSSPRNSAARLVDLADDDAGAERRGRRRPAASGRAARASSVVLPDPLAPVIATRSAQSICRSTGPSVNAPRRTTASPQRRDDRAGARRGRDRPSAAPTPCAAPRRRPAARSAARSAAPSPPASRSTRRGTSGRSCRCRWPCGARCGRPSPSRRAASGPAPPGRRRVVGVLLVLLAGVPAGDLALLQVGLVAAAVGVDLLLRQVELDDAGHRTGEELPVVADHHGPGPQPGDELLQPMPARPGRGRWSARRAGRCRTG